MQLGYIMRNDPLKSAVLVAGGSNLESTISDVIKRFGIKLDVFNCSEYAIAGVESLSDILICVASPAVLDRLTHCLNDVMLKQPVIIFPDIMSGDKKGDQISQLVSRLFSQRDMSFFEPQYQSVAPEVNVNSMKRALQNNEFKMYYQPIHDRVRKCVLGFESLVRWENPETGEIVVPDKFIPVIESADLIIDFGFWTIEKVCQQIKKWHDQYPSETPIRVSVNLSPRQFTCPELSDRIIQIVESHGIEPSSIALEITESAFMDDMDAANLMLLKLKSKKIPIYLDDFGTGFSSLSYLLHFPVDVIKIDKSFVQWMHVDQQSEEIVRSVISLAHNLGMKVVAEGVESKEHLEALESQNCDYIQGYYYARPLTVEDATDYLTHCSI